MKWFLIFAALFGVYFWMLISSTDMILDQTIQMHQQYVTVAEQADQIAAGNR